MRKKYDQNILNTRFDKESGSWKKLYETDKSSLFKYNNKKYRQQYALEMIGEGSGLILDLGCGSGSFFELLGKLGYRVVGLDSSSGMVELAAAEARRLNNGLVIRGNALKLPFADSAFNALLAVGLLEYFPADEDFLEKIKKIMKPGAKIVITLRNALCFERKLWKFYGKIGLNKFQADYYYREHNPIKFESLLKSMGFQNIQRRFCHFYPFPWPISKLAGPLNSFFANKMEKWFSESFINFLGSTYLVSFTAPSSGLGGQKTEPKDISNYLKCPVTGQAVKKADSFVLNKLNKKISSGELYNRGGKKIKEKLDEAYITADKKIIYPVKNRAPIFLEEESFNFYADLL
ncbi:MAG: class I SAM-dependent methyltransferase [Patescibacteria group bacterium]|nr:class I SAM-dependent methyltransferase [Patescibacteria group bacterium]